MKNFIENATIFYKNGAKQLCDAIRITDKGIYIGSVSFDNNIHPEFEEHGFIPRYQIQKIMISNEHGKLKDIDI